MNRLLLDPSRTEQRVAAAVAGLGFAVATVLAATTDDAPAVAFAPAVALVAVEFGLGAGVAAAALAVALFAVAAPDADASGIALRGLALLVVGALTGWLGDRLRATDGAHRQLLETANEGIWLLDADGVIRYVNSRMAEMLGEEREALVGRRLSFGGIEDRLARRRRGISEEYDVELPRHDGTRLWAHVNAAPLLDARGRYVGALAMVTDVTARRHAEDMLREAEEIASIGAWSWDVVRDEVRWSDELYRIHGLEPGELEPSLDGFLERVHEGDRAFVRDQVERAFASREPFSFTHRVVRPDGTTRILDAHGRVHVDDDGRVVRMTGVGHDVTERRLAEEQVASARVARRQATELNDNVVQGLVLAKYALERGDDETAARMLDGTLGQARRMISDLIGDERVRPGDLRRESAAGVEE